MFVYIKYMCGYTYGKSQCTFSYSEKCSSRDGEIKLCSTENEEILLFLVEHIKTKFLNKICNVAMGPS